MTFKPLLAATLEDPAALNYPLLGSYKYDGIRAVTTKSGLLSRSLKPIPNKWVQDRFSKKPLIGLDGELVVGPPNAPDVFNRTSSVVMSKDANADGIMFYAFDIIDKPDLPFDLRLYHLTERVRTFNRLADVAHPRVQLVTHHLINNATELEAFMVQACTEGYEGVMLRSPRGVYKRGRSTLNEQILLKYKLFHDAEAVVTGFGELMHNANEATTNELGHKERSSKKAGMVPTGKLGNLIVCDLKTRVEFEIGTGFLEQDRVDIWANRRKLLDRIVKYKYQPYGMKDKPRFPVFMGFRDPIDMGE